MIDKIIKWLRRQNTPVIKLKSGMPPRLRLVRSDAPVFDGSKIKVYVDFGHGLCSNFMLNRLMRGKK